MRILAALLVLRCAVAATTVVSGLSDDTRGGSDGRVIMVTRRDDNPDHPVSGSLRWALKQHGPRIVKFAVSGNITLQDSIIVREPFLTIDGSDAPGEGVCIRGGSLMFENTHDILVRQIRIRLGDDPARRQRREQNTKRPNHSAGLDCVSLNDSRRILFDHCSLSWSCDEIFGIVRCREVTIQWCILSEPLGHPRLHPYGENHAHVINASASTLSVHHCLFAHFVMRGPQFEVNDMRKRDNYPVEMEAVNNVIFDYQHSGSRYGCGVEKGSGTTAGKTFRFQFLNNLYLSDSVTKLPIESVSKHGVNPNVRVHASGNVLLGMEIKRVAMPVAPRLFAPGKGPVLPEPGVQSYREVNVETRSVVGEPFWRSEGNSAALNAQVSGRRLFNTPANSKFESAQSAAERVIDEAGCNRQRDAVDQRIINDVNERHYVNVARESFRE